MAMPLDGGAVGDGMGQARRHDAPIRFHSPVNGQSGLTPKASGMAQAIHRTKTERLYAVQLFA